LRIVRKKQIPCGNDREKSNGKCKLQVSPLRRKKRASGRDDNLMFLAA
jgi:hypothetical protein